MSCCALRLVRSFILKGSGVGACRVSVSLSDRIGVREFMISWVSTLDGKRFWDVSQDYSFLMVCVFVLYTE